MLRLLWQRKSIIDEMMPAARVCIDNLEYAPPLVRVIDVYTLSVELVNRTFVLDVYHILFIRMLGV